VKPNQQKSSSARAESKSWKGLQCLVVLLFTFVGGGATCLPRRTIPDFQPTPIFNAPPSWEQLAEALNRSRNIQSLQSNSVTVKANNQNSINTNVTWSRPKRFRLTASVLGLAGVDIGSNDEVFWMAIRDGGQPTMYFARHNEFDLQVDRPVLPVSPEWLIQAMGVCELDLARLVPQQQPISRPDGMIEISTWEPTPIGNFRRTMVVDPKYGYCREVFLFDPTPRLVAHAKQFKHQYYASVQTSLPHQVKVQLLPSGNPPFELDISIASYVINGLAPDNLNQFAMPNSMGYKMEDLGRAGAQAVVPQQVAPPQPLYPQVSYRSVPSDGLLVR
jgi:hypothetical protein